MNSLKYPSETYPKQKPINHKSVLNVDNVIDFPCFLCGTQNHKHDCVIDCTLLDAFLESLK